MVVLGTSQPTGKSLSRYSSLAVTIECEAKTVYPRQWGYEYIHKAHYQIENHDMGVGVIVVRILYLRMLRYIACLF